MKTSEYVSNLLTFCRNFCDDYNINYDAVNECNKETQDLLHQLELGPYKSRSKFATQIAHVRKKRRIAKDFVDINNDLVEYLRTPEFIKVQRQLEQLLGTCRKQERYIETKRAYKTRVRTDLTITQKEEKHDEC